MTDPVPVDSTPRHAPPEGPWPIAHPASGLRAPVSGGVLNGKATSKPQPAYPQVGLQGRAQGMVTVQLTIDEKGNVISARAISGHPLLQQAAVEAARKARFAPTRLNGTPVKVTGVITYNFVLEDAPD
jgi:protein TonB